MRACICLVKDVYKNNNNNNGIALHLLLKVQPVVLIKLSRIPGVCVCACACVCVCVRVFTCSRVHMSVLALLFFLISFIVCVTAPISTHGYPNHVMFILQISYQAFI